MHIVWLSWKDRGHPLAGGAEAVSGKLMDQLVLDGHTVTHITALYPGAQQEEVLRGVRIIRGGGRYSVYIVARKLFKRLNADDIDYVIDEMNTIPFCSALYSKRTNVLLTYQLARKVWFYQMLFPISALGYLIEPLYLRLIAKRYSKVLTESESTKQDLVRYGFSDALVSTFRVSIEPTPLEELPPKNDLTTVLSLGAIRPMKRTLEAVKAFESARDANPSLKMVLAGDDSDAYADKVKAYADKSRHRLAITFRGRVSATERLELMANSAVIIVTSIKEGWGLIVTEANSQGTPAIVYDVDGLRDSVRHGVTGIVSPDND
jgi:glycosyltransferase involved in cell wall biosynthesis